MHVAWVGSTIVDRPESPCDTSEDYSGGPDRKQCDTRPDSSSNHATRETAHVH